MDDTDEESETVLTPGLVLDGGIIIEQVDNGSYLVYNQPEVKFIICSGPNSEIWRQWEPEDKPVVYLPLPQLPWPTVHIPKHYESEETLYNEIRDFFEEHLDVADELLFDVYSAFVMASWRQEDFTVVPYLFFLGPLASGKTRALECFQRLCFRSIMAASMSSASLFRASHAWHPTVMLDETEVYNRKEMVEVVALLNSGYRRGQYAIRVEKVEDGTPKIKMFDVFGLKVLAGTQQLRATLSSRSTVTSMTKNVKPINLFIDEDKAEELRGKLLMYRFKNVGTPPPEIDFSGFRNARVAELFVALLSVAPSLEIRDRLINYAHKLATSRLEEERVSIEARIFDAIMGVKVSMEEGRIAVGNVTAKFNEGLQEKEQITSTWMGRRIRALGFEGARMPNGKRGFFWNEKLVERLTLRYRPSPQLASEVSELSNQHTLNIPSFDGTARTDTIPQSPTTQEYLEILRSTWNRGTYTEFDALIMETRG